MSEFKSRRVFNEEPTSKKNHHMGSSQHARAYWSDFYREKCWRCGLSEDTEKRPSSSSRRWKMFQNFGFNQMGLWHTLLIWPWICLKLTSRSASFWTVFHKKKKGAGAGHCTAPISVLWTISSGLYKGPKLRKQTNKRFWLCEKISPIFLTCFERIRAFSRWLPGTIWVHR